MARTAISPSFGSSSTRRISTGTSVMPRLREWWSDGRRPWLPLPPRSFLGLLGPCSDLLGNVLRDIRLLRLDETGHSVLKGEAIERRGLAVSASALLHVPSLTSQTFVTSGADVGCPQSPGADARHRVLALRA